MRTILQYILAHSLTDIIIVCVIFEIGFLLGLSISHFTTWISTLKRRYRRK